MTIEDSAELKFAHHPHVVRLEAREASIEGEGAVTIRDLVTNALRMRPDRIVVGEVRGAECCDMLQAMNTGHDGSLTTLHAGTEQETVVRLTLLARYGIDLPSELIEEQIAMALDGIVMSERHADGRRFVASYSGVRRGVSGDVELERYVNAPGRSTASRRLLRRACGRERSHKRRWTNGDCYAPRRRGFGGAFCRDGVWGRTSCAADAAGGAGAPDARIDGGEAAA